MSGEPAGTAGLPAGAPTPPSHPERPRPDAQRPSWWTPARKAWAASGAAVLVVGAIMGGVIFYTGQGGNGPQDYVEVYVTDLPANFSKLDVRLAGVYVGEPNYTLELVAGRFDLLSLQGPSDALLVAKGNVPSAQHDAVRIVFRSVRAMLNGQYLEVELPAAMLTVHHSFGLGRGGSNAVLFDLDVEKSLTSGASGLEFRPHVDAVYVHSYGGKDSPQGTDGGAFIKTAPSFKNESKSSPSRQDLGRPTHVDPKGTSGSPTSNSKFKWNTEGPGPTTTPPSSSSGPAISTPPTETERYLPDPGQVNSIPQDPTQIGGWFVQFADEATNVSRMIEIVDKVRGEVIFTFGSVAAAYVFMTPEQAMELSEDPDVSHVEADAPTIVNVASSKTAIRLPQLQDPLLGLTDAQGRPLDGRGVGVAVIDIGFDGTHPDLPHRLLSPSNALLAVNYKVESLFLVDEPNTDLNSGHGTHVLGILGGHGVLDPVQKGVAPGITAYGFSIGELSTTLWPNTALDWLVQNHDQVSPKIQVVQNSWGSGGSYDAQSLTTKLIEKLVDEGVVVVFSAGNSGGDGSFAATTSQCQIPKAGVICVAAYDDYNTGTRDGRIAPYSSRGYTGSPSSWPDVSAPGSSIRSTRPVLGIVTGIGTLDHYTILDGTSMAAPHVSGIAALMLQARPGLSPAQVESILESTAYKFADGGAYGPDGSAAKGHGLVDAYAAVTLAKFS